MLAWKVTFSGTQKSTPPRVWTYKDGTRFIYKRNEVSIEKYP